MGLFSTIKTILRYLYLPWHSDLKLTKITSMFSRPWYWKFFSGKAILWFFLRSASSGRLKVLAFSKKEENKTKKCIDVGKPFFSSNNCFNLKSEHSNGIEKNRNKIRNPLYSILLNFPITSTNFSAILILGSCLVICRLHSNDAEVPGLLFREFLWFFFLFFLVFQSDRPTQNQETHSTLNEKKGSPNDKKKP